MLRKLKQVTVAGSAVLGLIMIAQFARAEQQDTPPTLSRADGTGHSTIATVTDETTPAEKIKANFDYLFNSPGQAPWLTRTDFFYEAQRENTPVTGFETIQPLYQCDLCTLFGQGRAGYTSGGTTFNLGLGHRYLTPSKQWMFGANAFFDEIFRYPHKRVGLGGEVFTPYVTIRANYYGAYTGQRYTGDNTYERALSGFDASVETPVPYISWMRFTLKGYHWKGNNANDVNGGLVNLRVYPARQVELAVGVANDNSQHAQAFININYYFGSPDFVEYSASTPHSSSLFAAQDLEKVRLEKVLRVNPIVVEKRQGMSAPVIVARTD